MLAFDDSKYQGTTTVAAKASPAPTQKAAEASSDDTPSSPPLVQ